MNAEQRKAQYDAEYWEWVDSEFDRWYEDWEERDTPLTDQDMGTSE